MEVPKIRRRRKVKRLSLEDVGSSSVDNIYQRIQVQFALVLFELASKIYKSENSWLIMTTTIYKRVGMYYS